MKKVTCSYIHLGAPKTATTTLQSQLFANHSQIHYFGKFTGGGSSKTQPALRALHRSIVGRTYNPLLKTNIEEQLVFAAENGLTPAFSRESLAGGNHQKKRDQAKSFTERFGACKAILCVREPESLVKSLYSQKLKYFHTGGRHRGTQPRPDWTNSLADPPHYFDINEWLNAIWCDTFSPRYVLSYADTAEIYADVFGQENVEVLIFEEFVRSPKSFITQLCNYMGVDAEEGVGLIEGKRANESVTTEYIARIKALENSRIQSTLFRMSGPRIRSRMLSHKNLSGDKINPQISEKWLEKIHSGADEQNRRLVSEWGLPLADYGYRV